MHYCTLSTEKLILESTGLSLSMLHEAVSPSILITGSPVSLLLVLMEGECPLCILPIPTPLGTMLSFVSTLPQTSRSIIRISQCRLLGKSHLPLVFDDPFPEAHPTAEVSAFIISWTNNQVLLINHD